MKKVLLFLFGILIFTSSDASSLLQSPDNDPVILLDSMYTEDRFNEQGILLPSTKRIFYYDDIYSSHNLSYEKRYNAASDTWDNSIKTEYVNNDTLYDHKLYYWNEEDSCYIPSSWYLRNYNYAGNLLEDKQFSWENGEWVMIREIFYEYDENGLLIGFIINHSFGPGRKQLNEYDENGLLQKENIFTWDVQANDYRLYQVVSYYYENSLLSQDVLQNSIGGTLTFLSKNEYSYDNSLNLIEEIAFIFSPQDDTWSPDRKIVYGFDDNNNMTEKTIYDMNFSDTWEGLERLLYEYNSDNQEIVRCSYYPGQDDEWEPSIKTSLSYEGQVLVETLQEKWQEGEFVLRAKEIWSYNQQNSVSSRISYYWENQEWIIDSSIYFYYSEHYSTVFTQEVNQPVFAVYPNPAGDFVYVNNLKENSSLRIFDLEGKLILDRHNVSHVERINISILKPGMYLVEVNGQVRKFIKK